MLKYQQVIILYEQWLQYYREIQKDVDFDFEHSEPNREEFDKLSDYEKETIRRMAMTELGKYFRKDEPNND